MYSRVKRGVALSFISSIALRSSRKSWYYSKEKSGALLANRSVNNEHLLVLLARINPVCVYSHRTAMKDLGILRFAPQFSEGSNCTYSVSQLFYANVMQELGARAFFSHPLPLNEDFQIPYP
jgi:hypothetical protein